MARSLADKIGSVVSGGWLFVYLAYFAVPTAFSSSMKANESHVAQMIGYLAITALELALLLNFKEAKLTWKRVVR